MPDRKSVAGAYAKIEAHEEICAERYERINETLGDLKSAAKNHERAAWGIVLALLGWMAMQLWNNQVAKPQLAAPAAIVAAVPK